MRDYDVMIAGHLCLDIIPLFPDTGARNIGEIMCPGKLVNVDNAKISTGGPVSNTGLNMKKLGLDVCFCSCVGDDQFGKIALDMLSKSGNANGVKVLQGQTSSYTVVVAPPGIDRIFLHHPGTNNIFCADDLNVDLIKQSRHFHLGGTTLKRPPRGYDKDHPMIEDLKRKDFIAVKNMNHDDVLNPKFQQKVEAAFKGASDYMQFLCKAVGVPY